jgi:hypothetical protein
MVWVVAKPVDAAQCRNQPGILHLVASR